MFITHFSFASATLFTIPYVCMHERSYRIFFYCNLHLKMMSCKRLSIDWLCYSTLYKISIFSKASIFFCILFSAQFFSFNLTVLVLACLDISSKCRPIMYCWHIVRLLLKIFEYSCIWNVLQERLRSVHLFILIVCFVSVDK